jgi:anti-anti-sigma factor
MTVPEATFPVQWTGRQAQVVLPEHIDVSNAGQLREELLAVINQGAEALIADMTATVSCDHAGADAVARAYQRAVVSRTELRLVVTSEVVLRMLGMTGVGRLVPAYPSVEAALAARSPGALKSADASQSDGIRRTRLAGVIHDRSVTVAERTGCEADVGVEIALLDRDGVIAWVNQAWRAFAAANGGDPARTGAGVSYLQTCAAAGDDPVAAEVAAAIRAALAGDLPDPLTIDVPCHSPAAERWFDALISSRFADDGRRQGATVTLSLARARPQLRAAGSARGLRRVRGQGPATGAAAVTQGLLWKMIDAFDDGVALADGDGTLVLANRRLEEMFGYPSTELTGYPVERLIPAHLQRAGRDHLAAYAMAPRVRPMGAGARLTVLRKDGTTFPAQVSLRPVPTATGHFTLVVVRDVTADRRLAGQQAQPVQELPDRIVTALYQAGIGLQTAAELPRDTGTQRIEEALGTLNDLIGEIRDTEFEDRRQDRAAHLGGPRGPSRPNGA